MPETLILGRPYRLTLARVKRQKTTVRGKEYTRLAVSIPREDLEAVLGEDEEAYAIVYLARVSTVNLLNWDKEDELWHALPQEARTELYYHGQAPRKPNSRIVMIAAEENEVKQLGLDPEKPLTLADLEKAIRRKIALETRARS